MDILAEVIDLFTPHGGTVLDPYSVSISVAISSMKTGRKFICVENNSDRNRSALESLSTLLPSLSSKGRLKGVACTEYEKSIHANSKVLKGSTVEDVSTTSAHVHNTSFPQLTRPTTQHIPPTFEYSEKVSDVTVHDFLDVPPLFPPASSEETPVCSCPTSTVLRKKLMAPRTRGLRNPPAETATWVPNQKVTPLVGTLAVGSVVLFKEQNEGLCRT